MFLFFICLCPCACAPCVRSSGTVSLNGRAQWQSSVRSLAHAPLLPVLVPSWLGVRVCTGMQGLGSAYGSGGSSPAASALMCSTNWDADHPLPMPHGEGGLQSAVVRCTNAIPWVAGRSTPQQCTSAQRLKACCLPPSAQGACTQPASNRRSSGFGDCLLVCGQGWRQQPRRLALAERWHILHASPCPAPWSSPACPLRSRPSGKLAPSRFRRSQRTLGRSGQRSTWCPKCCPWPATHTTCTA